MANPNPENEIFKLLNLIKQLERDLLYVGQGDVTTEENIKIRDCLNKILECRDDYEGIDVTKHSFLKFHYHRLNSIFFKKLKNFVKSQQEEKISMNFAFYEHALSSEINTENQENANEEETRQVEKILASIEFPDFKQKYYEYINLNIQSIIDYIKHHDSNVILNRLADEVCAEFKEKIQENDGTYDETDVFIANVEILRNYVNKIRIKVRKEFMDKLLEFDEREFEYFFFNIDLKPSEIDSYFRKFSLYFHPDKNKHLPHQDTCGKLFSRLYDTKVSLQKRTFKDYSKYEDYITEAQKLFSFGLDYNYACNNEYLKLIHLSAANISNIEKNSLKILSRQYFKKAYENFKSACILADEGSQHQKMLECRINMASSLYLAELPFESQLAASTALKLIENQIYHSFFHQNDKIKVLNILEYIRLKKTSKIIDFLSPKSSKHENYDESYEDVNSQELLTNFTAYIRLNSEVVKLEAEKREQKSAIFANDFKKTVNIAGLVPTATMAIVAGADVAVTGYATYTGLSAVAGVAVKSFLPKLAIGALFFIPCVILYKGYKDSSQNLAEAYYHLNTRKRLDKIMREMQEFHANVDFKNFFLELSKKFDGKRSIISIDFKTKNQFEIEIKNIKKILFEFGFRPEAIAYLFVLLFEGLVCFSNSSEFLAIDVSETTVLGKARELLNAVICNPSLNDKENINLEKEARNLDDKLYKLRRNYLFESSLFSKVRNNFNYLLSFFTTNGIIDSELIKEGQVTSFISRLNEVKSIAAINKFIFTLFYEKNEALAKQSLSHVQEMLNLEYKYVTESHLRFEVLKDFIWLFTTNNELTNMVYKNTTQDTRNMTNIQNCELKKAIELEAKASRDLPIQKIKCFLEIKSLYEKIGKDFPDDMNLVRSAYIGYARSCLNLAKFKLVLKFLDDKKNDQNLSRNFNFWLIGSIAHRKINNNYDKASQFMTEAKRIDFNNELVQREAKKLEKLKQFDTKSYISLLDTSVQPHVGIDDLFMTRKTAKNSYKILSIDGGGVRGIIPAIWLCEIEKELKKPMASVFNMITGASTGAIIGAALTVPKNAFTKEPKPYSTADIVNSYMKQSRSVFLESKDSLNFNMYSDFRVKIFKDFFDNLELKESLVDIIIPAVCESDLSTFKFSNFDSKNKLSYYDALMATTSAPSYFKPHKISGYGEFLDVGLTCNNPTEIAYHEAIKYYGNDLTNKISVLSLGTGSFIPDSNFHSESYLPKLLYRGRDLKEYVLPPIEGDIDDKMKSLLSYKYHRWQVFTDNEIALDDCEETSITNLVEFARQHIEDLRDDENNSFNKVIELLSSNDD